MNTTFKGRLSVPNQAMYFVNGHLQSSPESRNTSRTSLIESPKPLSILKEEAPGLTVVKRNNMYHSILHRSFEGRPNVIVAPKLLHVRENCSGFRNP